MYCDGQSYLISKLWLERNSIDESPEYQRESAIWSIDKQQLFIDSILNKFDIPKLYFHDLRSEKMARDFAVVDGKQRLYTIYRFMSDELTLANDFKLFDIDEKHEAPRPGSKFSDLSDHWKELFRGTALSVVLIWDANSEDIEE